MDSKKEPKEIWKDIESYEGLYQISNYGRVKSLISGKILRNHNGKNTEYYKVSLSKFGKAKKYNIHRLVAQSFVDNPEQKPQVNHINGDKYDNKAENLEWVTASENEFHAYATGLKNPTRHPFNGAKSIPVVQMDKNRNVIKIYPSLNEAGRNGFRSEDICKCCKGKLKTVGGYVWMYAEEYKTEMAV